jgi:REP element-mobilizing transposase RayT
MRHMPNHSLLLVLLHVVWATHKRRKTIDRRDDERLHALVRSAAACVGCNVIAIGNASDHVHVIVRASGTTPVAELVRRMKGRSSFEGGWEWQRGYFAESVGLADVDAAARYVAHQRTHHDDSHPSEIWVTANRESAEGGLDP